MKRSAIRDSGCTLIVVMLLEAGCVSRPLHADSDPAPIIMLAQSMAEQVRHCYRRPAVPTPARQIVTRLRVRFTPEGEVAGLPQVLSQQSVTPETSPYAAKVAEAATLAVLQCAPFNLPPGVFGSGQEELEFTFSPVARG